MAALCYVNGTIGPIRGSSISVADLGLQRAYGVFDYGRTCQGKLFHFRDNLARLRRSAAALRLPVLLSDVEFIEIAEQLIEGSDLANPAIRILLTGGLADGSSAFEEPTLVVIAEEMVVYPEEIYERGGTMITAEFQRELPEVKSLNYMHSIRLDPIRRERGAFDILYHSHHGVTECPRNNFFGFHGDTLVTPKDHVLEGITRRIVLEMARETYAVEERRVEVAELAEFDETFITSTSKRVAPITKVDDRVVGAGAVGTRTRWLMERFEEYVAEYLDS